MGEVISRNLESADRFFLQQADQAIKRDVIRALLELITNSDDSYRRLEGEGLKTSGLIIVEVQRKDRNAVIRIRDYAQGMAGEAMDTTVGKYAAATSGIGEGQSVRGFYGRGLKDAILGLGHGTVSSIKDGYLYKCTLGSTDGKPKYVRYDAEPVDPHVRDFYVMPEGNGTVVEITVSRDEITVPQIDNIKNQLQLHYELRSLMQSESRRVILRYLDPNKGTKIKKEIELRYKPPVGELLLNEEVPIHGFGVSANLTLYRSTEPLSSPAEEGHFAQGGLVVLSGASAMEISLLKFENNEFAERFYGQIRCDHIRDLAMRGEPIATATRDGLNWRNHPFLKALKLALEDKIEPFVKQEEKNAKAATRQVTDKKLRERLSRVVAALNEIAAVELGDGGNADSGGGPGEKTPQLPASRFGFVPEFYNAQFGKHVKLLLRASVPDVIEAGTIVSIESNSPEISVLTPQVALEPLDGYPNIAQAIVEVEGLQVGIEGIVTASTEDLMAHAFIKVISKKVAEPHDEKQAKRHGIISGIVLDKNADPGQRVYFRRADSNVIIATRSSSVKPYLGEHGEGSETAQAQVMIAELVTEAVCKEIARRGVDNGTFLSLSGAAQDAQNREYIRIQNSYAHLIHGALVDGQYKRRDDETAADTNESLELSLTD